MTVGDQFLIDEQTESTIVGVYQDWYFLHAPSLSPSLRAWNSTRQQLHQISWCDASKSEFYGVDEVSDVAPDDSFETLVSVFATLIAEQRLAADDRAIFA